MAKSDKMDDKKTGGGKKMAAGGKVRGMGCAVKGGKMSPNSQ